MICIVLRIVLREESKVDSTTTSMEYKRGLEKYCTICKKTCGHWATEHDIVYPKK